MILKTHLMSHRPASHRLVCTGKYTLPHPVSTYDVFKVFHAKIRSIESLKSETGCFDSSNNGILEGGAAASLFHLSKAKRPSLKKIHTLSASTLLIESE